MEFVRGETGRGLLKTLVQFPGGEKVGFDGTAWIKPAKPAVIGENVLGDRSPDLGRFLVLEHRLQHFVRTRFFGQVDDFLAQGQDVELDCPRAGIAVGVARSIASLFGALDWYTEPLEQYSAFDWQDASFHRSEVAKRGEGAQIGEYVLRDAQLIEMGRFGIFSVN